MQDCQELLQLHDKPQELRWVHFAVEDMWHVYNLVRVGDMVTAKTFRKVTTITAAGGGSSERVVIKLTVQVEATEFDPVGGRLAFSTQFAILLCQIWMLIALCTMQPLQCHL